MCDVDFESSIATAEPKTGTRLRLLVQIMHRNASHRMLAASIIFVRREWRYTPAADDVLSANYVMCLCVCVRASVCKRDRVAIVASVSQRDRNKSPVRTRAHSHTNTKWLSTAKRHCANLWYGKQREGEIVQTGISGIASGAVS